MRHFLKFLGVFFLGKLCIFFADGAFGHRYDGKSASTLFTVFDSFNNLVYIIRNLGNQDNIRTSCHSCIKCKISHLMPHYFNNKHPSVGCRRRMYAIDALRSNVNSRLEAESHIRSVQIVIYCLGKCDYVEALLP